MAEDRMLSTAVAIVGGGPVGLALGLMLDHYGVKATIFNIEEDARWHPKGNTHNCRTMEHYRRLGIADAVRARGLPADHPTDVAYFTRFNAWEMARLPMPTDAEKRHARATSAVDDQTPEPMHRANQMYVEKFLLEHARTRPNLTLRYGWRVTGFTDDGDGVSLRAEREDGNGAESWRAAYLVGCDGGSSLVRRALGYRYQGPEQLTGGLFGGRMVATHLRAPTLYPLMLGHRRAWQYWGVNPELTICLVTLNGADEFLLHVNAPDPDRPPEDAAIARLVQRAAGADIPVEIIGHRAWTAGRAFVAEHFGAGRVLLAGDAVHIFTPTGGFGMNTGIDDAANLAWKLWARLAGWGGAGLLATYEAERRPIALRNTAAARAIAQSVNDLRVPPEIEAAGAAGDRARQAAAPGFAIFAEEFASIGVQLGARYDGSPSILSDGATPPADDVARYEPSSVPGGRAPHVWLDDGRGLGSSLFDRLGLGFTLLRLGPTPPDTASLEAAARTHGMPLTVLDVPLSAARDLYQRDLALIRPDHHVAWRGNRVPEDASTQMARVTGQMSTAED
jgi:2-polyprenyl-6-methoxyphenol hydroxylase-like FAD-dependent oxidoreductase